MTRKFSQTLCLKVLLVLSIPMALAVPLVAAQTTRPLPGTAGGAAARTSAVPVSSQIPAGAIVNRGAVVQSEPAWPRRFPVYQNEAASFGFVASQPGPISVTVSSPGFPIVVSLSGPLAQPLQQTGSPTVTITYNVTAADVQKGSLWLVKVSGVNGAGTPPSVTNPPLGTINVTHPAGNATLAQAELQRKQIAPRPAPPQAVNSALVAKQSAYMNQITTRQMAQRQTLLAQVSARRAPTQAVVNPSIATRTAPSVRTSGSGDNQSGSGSSSGSAASALVPVPPQITSISVNQGQPGDPLLINGNGFGAAQGPGEIHFMLNPGMDVTATKVDYWSDTQIVTYVPYADKIQGYNGELYVKAASTLKSQLVSFQFIPQMQIVAIDLKSIVLPVIRSPGEFDDCYIMTSPTTTGLADPSVCPQLKHVQHQAYDFWSSFSGYVSDDQFLPNVKLKNGWSTDSVDFRITNNGGGGAFLQESHIGTNNPFVVVHWWVDAFSYIDYNVIVWIKGPTGVPYQ